MNRNEEYLALLAQLDSYDVPAFGTAALRRRRRRLVMRPLSMAAAAMAVFVLLVNVSTGVAYACSKVPVLRELARAVRFSRSLTDAVDNDYVQPVDMRLEENGVRVSVEYLIVDKRQVNVFYRIESDMYDRLEAAPEFFTTGGEPVGAIYGGADGFGLPLEELRRAVVDFGRDAVPDRLIMAVNVYAPDPFDDDQSPPADGTEITAPDIPNYIAGPRFELTFDPWYTAQGRELSPDIAFELEGSRLRLASVEVYPGYLGLEVLSEENGPWLEDLEFYIVTDKGDRFDSVSNGVVSEGYPDEPERRVFRADSPFFREAGSATLYITGGKWCREGVMTQIDLVTERVENMPEGAELYSVKKSGSDVEITVLRRVNGAQTFIGAYEDERGNGGELDRWRWESGSEPDTWLETLTLQGIEGNTVYLTPRYTGLIHLNAPVSVEIPLE